MFPTDKLIHNLPILDQPHMKNTKIRIPIRGQLIVLRETVTQRSIICFHIIFCKRLL